MAKSKKSKTSAARPVVDITPTLPTVYDPLPPWPFTIPEPRPIPYGKPGKRVRVLIVPGRLEYDPVMGEMERRVRSLMEKGADVLIVVPDVYQGVGQIMARRNGLNVMMVNTDFQGATNLPTAMQRSSFLDSKTARRRVMREADIMYISDDSEACKVLQEEAEQLFPELRVRVLTHVYRKKAEPKKPKKKADEKAKTKSSKSATKTKRRK